ncbi:MAG: hypothetical protein NUV69_01640 [Candidatus Curtissbacteria bacterium]|nr:hypothetical protein [Candidatus Curtissbacteria bacterium]
MFVLIGIIILIISFVIALGTLVIEERNAPSASDEDDLGKEQEAQDEPTADKTQLTDEPSAQESDSHREKLERAVAAAEEEERKVAAGEALPNDEPAPLEEDSRDTQRVPFPWDTEAPSAGGVGPSGSQNQPPSLPVDEDELDQPFAQKPSGDSRKRDGDQSTTVDLSQLVDKNKS